jgi:hypothetical protein
VHFSNHRVSEAARSRIFSSLSLSHPLLKMRYDLPWRGTWITANFFSFQIETAGMTVPGALSPFANDGRCKNSVPSSASDSALLHILIPIVMGRHESLHRASRLRGEYRQAFGITIALLVTIGCGNERDARPCGKRS